MNAHERRFLLSERGTLERMLRSTPPEHVIDRMSLESRKREVEEQIAAFEAAPSRLVETQVAFRGGPIVDDGIEAGFAVAALGAFTNAIATVGVSLSRDHELDPLGRLPDRKAYKMVVRDTFPGSFGFQIEREFPHGAPPEEPDALEGAIEEFKSILEASADSDEALSETTANTDVRAVRSVHKFLKTMAKANAYCAIEFKGDQFRFNNADEVRKSAFRVGSSNIKEREDEMVVQFRGVLPEARKAEFVIKGTAQTTSGVVAGSVKDVSEINKFLDRFVSVTARVRLVGTSKPTYAITGWRPIP